ncbi:hypothetical protein KPC83_02270 [Collinsella sp. zg1085]|uniref:hypothetical protein n=1 Tax=Collinsella sp. zg1085 TaxID=2844380 RepID=UPI001C0BBDC3|nr:hypothetical protein [Collinsella sp. zg1085]QWT17984.1 hypothetical protein KPC83_02270 [Collinsella sp. zg1085]
MFNKLIAKEISSIKYQKRTIVLSLFALFIGGVMTYVISRYPTTGILLFGRENIFLVMVTLICSGICIEFSAETLLNDIEDGFRALMVLSGRNIIKYIHAKLMLPSLISLSISYCIVILYFLLNNTLHANVLGWSVCPLVIQVLFTTQLTFFISLFVKPEANRRPNFALIISIVNIPIIILLNPFLHPILYCLILLAIHVVLLVLNKLILKKLYRSNICAM